MFAQVTKASVLKSKPVMDKTLPFGKYFTDHMLEIEWTSEKGFGLPTISPHHNLSLDPAVPALHYAVQCFEGFVVINELTSSAYLFVHLLYQNEGIQGQQGQHSSLSTRS